VLTPGGNFLNKKNYSCHFVNHGEIKNSYCLFNFAAAVGVIFLLG